MEFQARNQHRTSGGSKVFWEGYKFFKLCPNVLNYVQHIFPGGKNISEGRNPLVTGLWKSSKCVFVVRLIKVFNIILKRSAQLFANVCGSNAMWENLFKLIHNSDSYFSFSQKRVQIFPSVVLFKNSLCQNHMRCFSKTLWNSHRIQ